MTILLLETATETCSVAVGTGDALVASLTTVPTRSHAAVLAPLIRDCLGIANLPLSALDAVAVSSGPGAYTSLRTGVATAKGLCYALGKPLIAVDTLHALAWAARDEAADEVAWFMPMLDARREEVWTALYDHALNVLLPAQPLILSNNSFENWADERGLAAFPSRLILAGNGASKATSGHFFEKTVKINRSGAQADYMWALAKQKYENSDFQDIAYFEPFYMKPPNITVSKKPVF